MNEILSRKGNFKLRTYGLEDRLSLLQNINDPIISEYTHYPYPFKEENVKEYMDERLSVGSTALYFAIDMAGEVIGEVGFVDINDSQAELEYWLAKKQRRQGVMKEAIDMIVTHGFDILNLRRIYAYVFQQNICSAKLLEKLGFIYEEMDSTEKDDGTNVTLLLYSKSKQI